MTSDAQHGQPGMYCTQCGAPATDPQTRFCTSCGTRFKPDKGYRRRAIADDLRRAGILRDGGLLGSNLPPRPMSAGDTKVMIAVICVMLGLFVLVIFCIFQMNPQ